MAQNSSSSNVEREFFRAMNRVVEPAVAAGFGSPGFTPWGMVVLETTGRNTGKLRRVPLLGLVAEGCVIVSTVRGSQSQWVQNALLNERVRYWLLGQPIEGTATIIDTGTPPEVIAALPAHVRKMTSTALMPAALAGWTFAVLQPVSPQPARSKSEPRA